MDVDSNYQSSLWWGGLDGLTRATLIRALYQFAGSAAPREVDSATAAKDATIERLTSILTGGEAAWQRRFLALQAAREQESRTRNKCDLDLRQSFACVQTDNAELRRRLDEQLSAREESVRVDANSSRKGRKYEDEMESAICAAFPAAVYTSTRAMPHAGDGILFAPDYGPHKCLFEFKAHGRAVGEADVAKLARDLDSSKASFAIMMTRAANVSGRRDFDVEMTTRGKPMLFLVRTDECIADVGTLVRLSLRCLARFADDAHKSNGYDPTEVAARYTRTYRRIKASITKFDQQWSTMRESMITGLDDLKDVVTPALTLSRLTDVLAVFDDRDRPVPVEEVQAVLRYRYPSVTKRTLVQLLRKSKECAVLVVRPGGPRWNRLCGKNDKRKTATFLCFSPEEDEGAPLRKNELMDPSPPPGAPSGSAFPEGRPVAGEHDLSVQRQSLT